MYVYYLFILHLIDINGNYIFKLIPTNAIYSPDRFIINEIISKSTPKGGVTVYDISGCYDNSSLTILGISSMAWRPGDSI